MAVKRTSNRREMMVIGQGQESEERVDLLLELTGIKSEKQIAALKAHLVQGFAQDDVVDIHFVTKSNLNRDLKKLNRVATVVEKIKDLDWAHLKVTRLAKSGK